tara:strand:- start:519 stop:1514 length:996 start_codon:yes stop_codon:yes gene_type:complete
MFISSFRNILFDYGFFKSKSHRVPIICVGNLSAGGSGKTPHTQYIISILKKYNFKIAIVSRGYGRSTTSLRYVETDSKPEEVGDEPLLIKMNYPQYIVVVEKDRNKGVEKILKDFPETEVIILDDGFQHRWIKPALNILITKYELPYYKDFIMPTGNLRESRAGSKRAQVIIVSSTPEKTLSAKKKNMISKLKCLGEQSVYFSNIKYKIWRSVFTNKEFQNKKIYSITLVTGVANSKGICSDLLKLGHKVNHLKYSDHHNYSNKDINNILVKFDADKSTKKLILTTEKDATKLKQFKIKFMNIDIYFVPIKISMEENNRFEKNILEYVTKN